MRPSHFFCCQRLRVRFCVENEGEKVLYLSLATRIAGSEMGVFIGRDNLGIASSGICGNA
jgi:hypothetical protein